MTQQHAEHHAGILKAFNAVPFTATVQLHGSLTTWLQNVPVSRALAAADMVVGRKVAVLFFDPTNPADAVVTAVYT
jgi:hypothetical protein